MFAVIQVGASQYKVSEGDLISTARVEGEEGKSVTLDKVLMYAKDTDVRIGQPYLPDVKVTAKVVAQTLADKVIAFKFRRRKNYSKKRGHRQELSELSITKISA